MEAASRSERGGPVEKNLDRVSADSLSPRTFLRRYFYPNRPVILTGAVGDWPALHWSPRDWLARLGDREVEVRVNASGMLFDNQTGESRTEKMKLSAFVDEVLSGAGHRRLYYAQQDLRPLLPDWEQHIRRFRFLRRTDYLKDVNLWFGDQDCVTPLHFDFLHNFFVQLQGRKEFVIFAQADRPYLYPNVDRPLFYFVSRVSVPRPDLQQFPAYRNATAYRFVLGPGEGLFMPAGWWHCVRSLDVSISVNQWWTRMFSRNTQQLRLIGEFVGTLIRTKLQARRAPAPRVM
jgi:ribosomal protein L16 Arg81 hydroxylase